MATQSQRTKNIDVNRSFIPVDPKAFPENYNVVTAEDSPDKNKPVVAYEGYNFLPTSYGYKSYFGVASELDIEALTSRIDDIVVFQTQAYENILIAMCEDGIWTKRANTVGAWAHVVVLDIPEEGYIRNWTHCVISNDFYCYRSQGASFYKVSSTSQFYDYDNALSPVDPLVLTYLPTGGLNTGTYAYAFSHKIAGVLQAATAYASITTVANGAIRITFNSVVGSTIYRVYRLFGGVTQYYDIVLPVAPVTSLVEIFDDTGAIAWITPAEGENVYPTEYFAGSIKTLTPNFLNMLGQQGIFKAGGRLGFWDSANSVAWSNLDDFTDFTPAILTMAGNTIFQEVLGKIVTIQGMAEDFVIYSTKSIVLIRQTESTSQIWASKIIVKGAGVVLPREVAVSTPDITHFAYASNGLYKIERGEGQVIVPEVTDYLKESALPVYLRILEGRFLFLGILDDTYIDGLVSTTEFTLPPEALVFETPIYDAEAIEDIVIDYSSMCSVLAGVGGKGAPEDNTTDEQQTQAETDRLTEGAPAKKTGTFFKPIWACFLSKAPVGGDITWVVTPCAGLPLDASPPYPMSPSPDAYNHLVRGDLVYTPSPYLDGWTIERFMAVQSALWEAEENARNSFISALTSRVSPTTEALVNDTAHGGYPYPDAIFPPSTTTFCGLGTILTQYTGPALRIGPCSFSLFRLGIAYTEFNTITSTRYSNTPVTTFNVLRTFPCYNPAGIPGVFPSIASAISAGREAAASGWGFGGNPTTFNETSTTYLADGVIRVGFDAYDTVTGLYINSYHLQIEPTTQERYTGSRFAYNAAVGGDQTLVADEPYCTIVSWEYTDINDVTRTIPASVCGLGYPSTPPTKEQLGLHGEPPLIQGNDLGNIFGNDGTLCGLPYESVTIPAIQATPIDWYTPPVSVPPTSFLLQDGSIGPVYPTIPGALVYDLQLQKWGKMKQEYKVLVDYMPLNNSTANIVDYETFGMVGGLVKPSGKIALFDENPIDSYIKYGKIGYYRTGFTKAEEVRVSFRSPSSGTILLETSLDGSVVESTLTKAQAFADVTELVFYPSSSGRWHNIKIDGNYDIKHLEFRGTIVGNR